MNSKIDIAVATDQLIEHGKNLYGTYHAFIKNPNLIDLKSLYALPTPKFLRSIRLKEWQAFQIISDQYFVIGAVYNAKVVGVSQCVIYDKYSKKIYDFHKKTFPFKQHVATGLNHTISHYKDNSQEIKITNDAANNLFTILMRHDDFSLEGKGRVEGDVLSIYHPLLSNHGIYSTKMVMPFYGHIDFGEGSILLDNAILIIDDHKGYYPHHMVYHWATGANTKNGDICAFNLTQNQVTDPDMYNENVLWFNNQLHHFGKVEFTIHDHYWTITDMKYQIQLEFYPEADYQIHDHLGVIRTDYVAPIGYFTGNIILEDGQLIEVDHWTGMTEWIDNII